jgi:hypothetical protein
MLGTYTGIVTAEFIKRRDYMVSQPNWKAGIRGADAEFPEWHQALIDPNQTLYEGWEWDTNHLLYGTQDYKQFSQAGVLISPDIQKVIEQDITDNLAIWEWSNGNRWVELKEGMEVSYDIIGIRDAKECISKLNHENRFTF